MVVVYAVECAQTGHAYVGITSGKLSKRFREHRCLAKSGKHHSVKLNDEWQQHGDGAFSIKPLEVLDDDATLIEKRSAELKWLREYDARGALLNQAIISFAPTPEATAKGIEASRAVVGNRWTPEANEKRRQAQLGKPKNHGHKISATKRAKQVKR